METARDRVLAGIRSALKDNALHASGEVGDEREVFAKCDIGLAEGFVKAFTAIDGQVMCCDDFLQLGEKLAALLRDRQWRQVVAKSDLLERHVGQAQKDWDADDVDGLDLEAVEAGITDCEFLAARTGTVVMSTAQAAGRAFPVYTPVHIVIAQESQLVADLGEAIAGMQERYGMDFPSGMYLVSGPSRTGDIEKTLVLGVHGPVEVFVFLVKQ